MARVPSSKYYQCPKCSTRFLRVFDLFFLRFGNRKKPVQSHYDTTKIKSALIIFIVMATVYFSYSVAHYFYEHESVATQEQAGP